MNVYIKYSLVLMLGLLSVTSCDVMDTKPMESYDENLVWSSKETAESFIFNVYNDVIGGLYAGQNASMEALTPNGVMSNLNNLHGFPTEVSIDRYTDQGFDQFARLRKCNMIIEKVGASSLGEAVKKELIAEGHLLRGLVFFYQARWMGRFVPITRLLSPNDKEDFATPLTANVAASYDQILADFKIAARDMPEESLPGRANRYVAQAFISKSALQAYAYTRDSKYLDMCITASHAVINSQKYVLTSEYGDLFLEKGARDREIIMGYYRLSQNTETTSYNELMNVVPNVSNDDMNASKSGPHFKDANGRSFGAWGVYFPTQDLIDQYLVIDRADHMAKPLYETSQYKTNVEELLPSSLAIGDFTSTSYAVPDVDDMGSNAKGEKIVRYAKVKNEAKINELMYQNRDKRFYATVVYDSCYWLNNELVTTCCNGNLWAGVRPLAQSDSWYTTATGYYWRKGVYNVQPNLVVGIKTDYHFVIARLAEMYMNLAEAYLLKKDVTNAVSNINETRVKHGALPPSTATTEAEAWIDYMRERRVEMVYENDIYWSYLRWGQYGGYANYNTSPGGVIRDLDMPVHKIQITKDRKRFFIGQVVRNGAWNRNFTERRYLMPIPQGQIDKRAASGIIDTNNPGW